MSAMMGIAIALVVAGSLALIAQAQ